MTAMPVGEPFGSLFAGWLMDRINPSGAPRNGGYAGGGLFDSDGILRQASSPAGRFHQRNLFETA